MQSKTPYLNKKTRVVRAIEDVARRGDKVTYGDLGRLVGIPAQGPWKPLLDEIGREYRERNQPDISYLVVSSNTGYPSQVEFVDARKPTPAQKQKADEVIRRVHAAYTSPEKPIS